MIKLKKKICKICEKESYIFSKGRCKKCSAKKKNPPKKEKSDDQLRMFLTLWKNSNKVSEISGKPLLGFEHSNWHWQFEHILSKGAYPSFKLNPENIMLMLPEEHIYLTDNTDKAKQDPLYKKYFEKKELLKQKYYELHPKYN